MLGMDKLLLTASGHALIKRAALAGMASKAREVIVVLRRSQELRQAELAGLKIVVCYSESAVNEMSATLKAGMSGVAPHSDGVLILLPDMPAIETGDIDALISEFDGSNIVRARSERGQMGHPVLIPNRLFWWFSEAEGDRGLQRRLASGLEAIHPVSLSGDRATTDIDTPGDWLSWQGNADR